MPGGELVAQYYTIWMRENDWVLTRINTQHLRVRPSRAALMLALVNITSFSVRLASPGIPLKAVRYASKASAFISICFLFLTLD